MCISVFTYYFSVGSSVAASTRMRFTFSYVPRWLKVREFAHSARNFYMHSLDFGPNLTMFSWIVNNLIAVVVAICFRKLFQLLVYRKVLFKQYKFCCYCRNNAQPQPRTPKPKVPTHGLMSACACVYQKQRPPAHHLPTISETHQWWLWRWRHRRRATWPPVRLCVAACLLLTHYTWGLTIKVWLQCFIMHHRFCFYYFFFMLFVLLLLLSHPSIWCYCFLVTLE